jgi:hypothetical protein
MITKKEPAEIAWLESMDEAERAELSGLLTAYDTAIEQFQSDHTVVFPSDAERNRLFYGFLKRWGKARSKPGPCMHDGCTKVSIARSHTISLGSIRLIAENGHVVTPQFGENGLEVVPIGVHEASTFPAFCDEHELQFAAFEKKKKEMSESEHFRLQAFRTVCREIYTKRYHQRRIEAMLADYRRLREEFVIGRIKQAYTGNKPVNISALRFENDPLEMKCVELLDGIRTDLPELEKLYRGILDDLRADTDNVAMIVANFDMKLDVCLSGLGVINYIDNGLRKCALCFLGIIPEDGQTKIMIGATAEHDKILKMHTRDQSSPAVLEMLESWMVDGTDHWFMRPSAWAAITEARQRAICDRIFVELLSIADSVPFSILDGTRRHLIAYIERQLANGAIPPHKIAPTKEVLAREKAKIDYAPATAGDAA